MLDIFVVDFASEGSIRIVLHAEKLLRVQTQEYGSDPDSLRVNSRAHTHLGRRPYTANAFASRPCGNTGRY